ncbi:hypothetical protein RCL1_002014 [Eukaryota sp. TZLM3-RCL]
MSAGGARKKWSKGRVRDKINNAVFLTKEARNKLMKEIPSKKVITPYVVSDALKVNVTVAKDVLRQLVADGVIRPISTHSTLSIYSRSVEETQA